MIRGVSQGVNTQRMNLQRGEEYKLRKVVMIVSRAGRIADFVQQRSYATGQSETQMRKSIGRGSSGGPAARNDCEKGGGGGVG